MSQYNPSFINIQLNHHTLYVYSVRKLLHESLDKHLNKFKGTLLDLGCGEMPYRQYILDKNKKVTKYIGVDVNFNKVHQLIKPDLYWDGHKIKLKENSIDTVIATELFEHIPNIGEVLAEIYRILKPSGLLYLTVPFIWPLHEVPYDEFRYTPYSLERFIAQAKFKNILIHPIGCIHSSLAQILCIWISTTRKTFSSKTKKIIFSFIEKVFFYPLIKLLLKYDKKIRHTSFSNNGMFTGFSVNATK